MKRRFSPLRSVGVGLAVALAACGDSSTEPPPPPPPPVAPSLSVGVSASGPFVVAHDEVAVFSVSPFASSDAESRVDSLRSVYRVGGDSVSSRLWVSPSSQVSDTVVVGGPGDSVRVEYSAFGSARNSSGEVFGSGSVSRDFVRGLPPDSVLFRVSSEYFLRPGVVNPLLELDVETSSGFFATVGVDSLGVAEFSVPESVDVLLTPRSVGEQALVRLPSGNEYHVSIAVVEGGGRFPVGANDPSVSVSGLSDQVISWYTVDRDIPFVLSMQHNAYRSGVPIPDMATGELIDVDGAFVTFDPRRPRTNLLFNPVSRVESPFVADPLSSEQLGHFYLYQSIIERLFTSSALGAGLRPYPDGFFGFRVESDLDAFLSAVDTIGYPENQPATLGAKPGYDLVYRLQRPRAGVDTRLVDGGLFMLWSSLHVPFGNVAQLLSESYYMGYRDSRLSLDDVPGQLNCTSRTRSADLPCYFLTPPFGVRPEFADPFVPELAQSHAESLLLAHVFGVAGWEAYGRPFRPFPSSDRSWRNPWDYVAGVVRPAPPGGFVRSEGGLFVRPFASVSVGDAGLALRSAERVYRVPGIDAPVYFEK